MLKLFNKELFLKIIKKTLLYLSLVYAVFTIYLAYNLFTGEKLPPEINDLAICLTVLGIGIALFSMSQK